MWLMHCKFYLKQINVRPVCYLLSSQVPSSSPHRCRCWSHSGTCHDQSSVLDRQRAVSHRLLRSSLRYSGTGHEDKNHGLNMMGPHSPLWRNVYSAFENVMWKSAKCFNIYTNICRNFENYQLFAKMYNDTKSLALTKFQTAWHPKAKNTSSMHLYPFQTFPQNKNPFRYRKQVER